MKTIKYKQFKMILVDKGYKQLDINDMFYMLEYNLFGDSDDYCAVRMHLTINGKTDDILQKSGYLKSGYMKNLDVNLDLVEYFAKKECLSRFHKGSIEDIEEEAINEGYMESHEKVKIFNVELKVEILKP